MVALALSPAASGSGAKAPRTMRPFADIAVSAAGVEQAATSAQSSVHSVALATRARTIAGLVDAFIASI
jgi:hypothetical protein